MVIQRVRVVCPSCSRSLKIRVACLGKEGECRYCGHRFRAGTKIAAEAMPDRVKSGVTDHDGKTGAGGHWTQMLEHELQQTWDLWTSQQAGVVEKLIAEIGDHVQIQESVKNPSPPSPGTSFPPGEGSSDLPRSSHDDPRNHEGTRGSGASDDEFRADLADSDPLFRVAQAIVSAATPAPNVAEGVDEIASDEQRGQHGNRTGRPSSTPVSPVDRPLGLLLRERDEARAECVRLLEMNRVLRSDLAAQKAEVERLRGAAEKLQSLRAENDRLHREREMHGREMTQLQERLVEIQISMVETEAELDDCRDRVKVERDNWKARRQKLLDEAAHQLDEQRGQFEVERRAWRDELEVHRKIEQKAETLQVKVNKLRGLYDITRQQRDELSQQVEALSQKVDTLDQRCARLGAYLDEAETEGRASEQNRQAEIDRLNAALGDALEEVESAQQREADHVAEIRALQDEVARLEGNMTQSAPS